MALIELDRDAPLEQAPGRRPPPWRYRHAGLLMTAVLMLALGGAAPYAATLWRELGTIGQAGDPETPIQLAGGRLYTVGMSERYHEVTAWALDGPPRRVWTARTPIGMSYNPVSGYFGAFTVRQAGDVVLLSEGFATTALDKRTGQTRWTLPLAVWLLGTGGVGLAAEQVFRPGTVYDQASGDPGALYFSATGEPHTEPPVRTQVHGVDLATGEVRWTTTPGGSVTVDPVHGDVPAVLITSSDRLTLHDGDTGDVRAEVALPELNGSGPVTASVAGDVALISYRDPGQQVAYDVRTLRRLWSRDLPEVPGDVPDCRQVICWGPRNDLYILDPATGEPAWPANGDIDITVRAGFVLETKVRTGRPDRLADLRDGTNRVVLTGWDRVLPGDPDATVVVRRDGDDGGQIFAAVRPGHPELRILGTADVDSDDCAADDHRLVCRDSSGLRVWAYRI
ncbi:PQQ-binding-like beta-propeller repeat protein [Actinoplanes sp. GCM10030250]|uniref:outer membrane protein assembly factor BamB family protein n=1 Tax=Actinoplanes sp. GCM10030250 TaxID=3273376 RepID=UPI0036153F0A